MLISVQIIPIIPQDAPKVVVARQLEKLPWSDSASKINEHVHFRMFRLLQDSPEMSQRELAEAMGITVGGAHYVLNALLENGPIKLGNSTAAKHKRCYPYVLTPKGAYGKAAITKRYFARKIKEYETLKSELDELSEQIGKLGTSWIGT